MGADTPPLPFADSLCHRCGAPPRYVTSDRGTVFVYCPVLCRYPPQPLRECAEFRARPRDPQTGG